MTAQSDKIIPAPSLSAEVFSIPLDTDRYLIYAPLRRAAFVGNASTVNFLAALKENRYDISVDPDGSLVEFLRRIEIVDGGAETRPAYSCTGVPEPTSLTLFLTTACNLRCSYCYASTGDMPKKSMPLHTAVCGIDFIISNAIRKKEPRIGLDFHGGGEPTMNWQTMTASLAYARGRCEEMGLEILSHSATNGVLNDRQIDWIIANLQGASVSFDGLPEVHNTYRTTTAGTKTSKRVLHTIKKFDEAGFDYGIRATVTADTVSRLADSVDYICTHSLTKHIQLEPAYKIGRWKEAPTVETQEFIEWFRAAQTRARKHGRAISFSAARTGLLTNHFCSVSRDSFALTADGMVSSCFEVFSEHQPLAVLFFYGKPADSQKGGYQFDMEMLQNLRNQSVKRRTHETPISGNMDTVTSRPLVLLIIYNSILQETD